MVKLLNRARRKPQKESQIEDVAPQIEAEPRDRILVLLPGEGGFSFRLLAFPSTLHASAYIEEHFPQRTDQVYTFRPHHDRPRDPAPGTPGQVEAVVMVRDPERHGTVHLYSFVDMDTAQAFVRAEGMRGLNLRLVLVFWAEPIALYGPAANGHDEWAAADLAAPQQASNPLFDTLTRTGVTESAIAAEPADAEEAPVAQVPDPIPAAPPPLTQPVQPVAPPPPPPMAQVQAAPPLERFIPPAQMATPTNTSYATGAKQARRWNSGEAAPIPSPSDVAAPATARPAQPGGSFIKRLLSWPGWDGFGPLMRDAALLKWEAYDELRKDPYAAGRAGVIVGATVGAAALSAFFIGPLAFFFHGFFSAIGWAVYALCIYVIGTQFFGGQMERGDTNLFLHRLGLAFAPAPLIVLGIIPIYGPIFTLVGLIWVMMTSIKATEVGLELDRQSSAYTVIISWLALFAVAIVIPGIAS